MACDSLFGKGSRLLAICFIALLLSLLAVISGEAQTAAISDAWWTFQQDCNGDGYWAGLLPGNLARLNWNPDVSGCSGTLTVFEIVYTKTCASSVWTPIYTNSPHDIVGCRSSDSQFFDVSMDTNSGCHEYKIEVYRNDQVTPDDIRASTNDADLAEHKEQSLANDACQSDLFAFAVALHGTFGSHADNNTYATREPGEPHHAGNPGGKSLWYTWTPTTNDPVTFDTQGSTFDTVLAVYTGNNISNLTLVASNDDINGAMARQSSLTFTPSTGATYRIAVDGFGGASGIVELNWNQSGGALPDLIIWGPATSPEVLTRTFTSNDCEVVEGCAIAGTRTLLSFTTESRNIGAGDLLLGDPSTNSLFVFAECHQHYHFEEFANYSLVDTNGNTVAAGHKVGFCLSDVHSFSPSANPTPKYDCDFQGIQAGWADVYAAGLPCQYIDITGVPPGDYRLRFVVNPDNLLPESDTNNNVTLVDVSIPPVNCTGTPANDNFANALVITNSAFSYTEFNNCATSEPDEPNHLDQAGGHSVWFSWTAPFDQTAVVNTKRSDFDTVLAIYTGNNVSGLSLVASNDDIITDTNVQSQLSFDAIAGTTYSIAVDGYFDSSAGPSFGRVVLNFNPPGNDDFENAWLLSGTSGTKNDYNSNTSKEPYEPAHAADVGGKSVWFKWVAPIGGPVNFDTLGSTFDTTLAVYTNRNPDSPDVTNLTVVVSNDDDAEGGGLQTSRVSFNAVADTTYMIAVDGFVADSGNIQLHWNMNSTLKIDSSGTQVQVTLTGVDWQRYSLIQSSNFQDWITNAPITMSGGSHVFTFTNEASTNAMPRQYFRSILAH